MSEVRIGSKSVRAERRKRKWDRGSGKGRRKGKEEERGIQKHC